MKKIGSKAKRLKAHAKQRAYERYEIYLNGEKLRQIARLIQDGKSQFIRKRSNRVTEQKVIFCDITFRLLYDKQRKQVITFLPQTG